MPRDDRHLISPALGWLLDESYYGVTFPGAFTGHTSGHWYGLTVDAAKHALLNLTAMVGVPPARPERRRR